MTTFVAALLGGAVGAALGLLHVWWLARRARRLHEQRKEKFKQDLTENQLTTKRSRGE